MAVNRFSFYAIIATCSICTLVCSTMAGTITETGDYGDMLASAYPLPGGTDKIQGSLDYDADLYKFYWNGGDFFANTVDYAVSFASQQDCELFLFDDMGYGIVANNDAWDGFNVPVGSAYVYSADLTAGYYYLGVTIHNLEPVDDSFYYTIFPTFPYVSEPKPADPLSGPLAGWGNDDLYSWANGNYIINFAEASLIDGSAGTTHPTGTIPEPATMALLGLGGLLLGRRK